MKEENYFLKIGHPKEHLPQLKRAMRDVKLFLDYEQPITKEDAVSILGKKCYLSGISRAAFHATAVRQSTDGKKTIFFDLLHWW